MGRQSIIMASWWRSVEKLLTVCLQCSRAEHPRGPLFLFSQFMGLCCLDSGWVSPLSYTSLETTLDSPRGIQTGWPWTLTHHPHSKQCWKLAWFHPGHESSFCPTCASSIHYPFISLLVAACLLGQTVTVYQSVEMNTAESVKSSVLIKQRGCGDLFRASARNHKGRHLRVRHMFEYAQFKVLIQERQTRVCISGWAQLKEHMFKGYEGKQKISAFFPKRFLLKQKDLLKKGTWRCLPCFVANSRGTGGLPPLYDSQTSFTLLALSG